MGKDKAKNLVFVKRQIKRDKDLLENWRKHNIPKHKQDKLEAKIARAEALEIELES